MHALELKFEIRQPLVPLVMHDPRLNLAPSQENLCKPHCELTCGIRPAQIKKDGYAFWLVN